MKLAISVLMFFLLISVASAQPPRTLSYQGLLTDDVGTPVPNGSYTVTFRLYTVSSGGSPIWAEVDTVQVESGVFQTLLGDQTLISSAIPFDQQYWLGVQVGTGTEMAPRVKLSATPYSMRAHISDTARIAGTIPDNAVTSAKILDGTIAAADMASNAVTTPKIADAAVTTTKISSAGAATGQALVFNGTNVTWGSPGGGLTLPYSGSASFVSTSGVFDISNTATTGLAYGIRGLSSSSGGMGLYGSATSTTGFTSGVGGHSASSDGVGISGAATSFLGTTYGVSGVSWSSSGTGVKGVATSTSGATYGVYGSSSSSGGTGVQGEGTATTGLSIGVHGVVVSSSGRAVAGSASSTTGTTYGMYGQSASSSGTGVFGIATSTTGATVGVRGLSNSPDGWGVLGLANSTTGQTYGVRGVSSSTSGTGVYGNATATTGDGWGVWGSSASSNGRGVVGTISSTAVAGYGVFGQNGSPSGNGVYGYTTSATGTTFAVFGDAISPSGYGVYSLGNFAAFGTKAFQIDHPQDPANKYLNHYCTEGPQPLNVYSGNVTLDVNGSATVDLPPYFEEINKEFRYQLTPIGGASPDLHIAEEIAGNRFKIAGGRAGTRVSWRVEAVRNDLWVRQHGAPVEVVKTGESRGKYLRPELYGLSKELRVHYVEHDEREHPYELALPEKPLKEEHQP